MDEQNQPAPKPTNGPAIADLVIADMYARKQVGIERYGVPLQAHNGRDGLQDAYEEALDLAVYLRQVIEERNMEAAKVKEEAAKHEHWCHAVVSECCCGRGE